MRFDARALELASTGARHLISSQDVYGPGQKGLYKRSLALPHQGH